MEKRLRAEPQGTLIEKRRKRDQYSQRPIKEFPERKGGQWYQNQNASKRTKKWPGSSGTYRLHW